MEIWKDIQGYEGLYQVSNYGNVKSLNYRMTGKERILKSGKTVNGYLAVDLCKNGKRKHSLIHRLVAQAFLENPNNYPQVNHKDENKQNNHVSNLEFCTSFYNMNYGTRNEGSKKIISETMKGKFAGEKHPLSRKVMTNTGEIFTTVKEAAEWSGTHRSHISGQIQGKRKTAGKHPVTKEPLQWKYID